MLVVRRLLNSCALVSTSLFASLSLGSTPFEDVKADLEISSEDELVLHGLSLEDIYYPSDLEDVAYSCDADCGEAAKFRYPCPTFRNPGRKCDGKNHVKYAACEADKAVSCRLWNSAASWFEPKVKPHLMARGFGRTKWLSHVERGTEGEYITDCTAAGVAILATVGTTFGGPYVGLAGGAAGLFVAKRICEQSTHW